MQRLFRQLLLLSLVVDVDVQRRPGRRIAFRLQSLEQRLRDVELICREEGRLTFVLGVRVAERVLTVCVPTVAVVDLARIRVLVLLDAKLMI